MCPRGGAVCRKTRLWRDSTTGFFDRLSHVASAFAGTTVQDNTIHETPYGQLVNSYVPIRNDSGEVVAILGCAYNAAGILDKADTLNLVVFVAMLVGVILVSAACLFLVHRRTKPLETATEIISKVCDCDLQEYKDLKISNNEIGDIIRDSVTMSKAWDFTQ